VFINHSVVQYKRQQAYEMNWKIERENKKLTNEDIIDIFVTALEGGSNYWYEIPYIPMGVKDIKKSTGLATSEAIGKFILQGGSIDFYDVELIEYDKRQPEDDKLMPKILNADESFLGAVDMDSILEAITLTKNDYPDVWEHIMDEDFDAGDSDVFLQLCVMGDVVYG
jgi:hypothetical protein